MKKLNKPSVTIFLGMILTLFSGKAYAHFLWLNANPYKAEIGKKVEIEVGWGHCFPRDSSIEKGFIESIYAISPNGKKIVLEKVDEAHYFFVPRLSGIHVVEAKIKPGFGTKTVTGFKFQTKEGLKDVIKCFHFDRTARAIVLVGKPDKSFNLQESIGPLEILLVNNPYNLQVGDMLKIKLLFQGKPLPYTHVYATYAGFSKDPNTYCYTTMTDKNGTAEIKMLHGGEWLLKVFYKKPYPNPKVCDEFNFVDSVTFQIR
ncbi:MAG: DUF4198 domain-containing protein [Deltaproteobacteria bacterium]|nr:DUF4198 domain-containing protein [Deltaproteobacteria bacterium]